ncbi:MAG: hypothetical protein H6Q20_1833, partial [Bacteroidetes bacterium]|nr:hypothetical protein [Bacteroidota bacterium]
MACIILALLMSKLSVSLLVDFV